PYGEVARALESYVSYSEPSGITRQCELVIASARTDLDARDRREVADRVQRAIALSGVSAREFAAALGTSASRLSTYANGKVVPSAALLMRMEREAARADDHSLPRGRHRTP
ncbi:MAG: helix-turn-helix transcriptional regulator, partial [Actinobacteria bacterium]|nr:helix-turn-helix transcriptional regulator [Actinomycetota bacterium]